MGVFVTLFKNYIFAIAILAILITSVISFNLPSAEAFPVTIQPFEVGYFKQWKVSIDGAIISVPSDFQRKDAVLVIPPESGPADYLFATKNNEISDYKFPTGLPDSTPINSAKIQVDAKKIIAGGVTKIRIAIVCNGIINEGAIDYKLTTDIKTWERTMTTNPFTGSQFTAGDFNSGNCTVGPRHQTDARESRVYAIRLVLDVPDAIPPTLTGTLGPLPNSAGWNNSPVTVTWSCVDNPGGSGVASFSPPETYSGPDTDTEQFSGTCSDNAGNTATLDIPFKYDATAPTINDMPADIVQQAATTSGSIITYTNPADFSDNLSGVDSFLGCTPASGSLFPIATNVASCELQDFADNIGSDTFDVLINPYLAFNQASYYLGQAVQVTVADPSQSGTVDVTLSSDAFVFPGNPPASITFQLVDPDNDHIFTNGIDETANPPQQINARFVASASNQITHTVQAAGGGSGSASYPITSPVSFAGPVSINSAPSGGAQNTASTTSPFVWSSETIEKNAYGGFTVWAKPAQVSPPITASVFNPLCTNSALRETISVEVGIISPSVGPKITVTATERSANACVFDSNEQILFSDTLANSNSPATLLVTGEAVVRGQPIPAGSYTGTAGGNTVITNPFVLPTGGTALPTTNLACPIGEDPDNDGFCTSWEMGGPDGALRIPRDSVAGTVAEHIYPADGGCTHLYVDARNPHISHAMGTPEPAGSNAIYTDSRNLMKCFDPTIPDVALEVQPMRGHVQYAEAMLKFVTLFQNSPLSSDDCPTCRGPINVHVYHDNIMGNFHVEKIPYDAPIDGVGGTNPVGGYKQLRDQFFGRTPEDRNTADCPAGLTLAECDQWILDRIDAIHQGWRFMMTMHSQKEAPTSSGRAEIPGDDSISSLGKFSANVGTIDQQYATAVHEFAHLIGNNHNGRFDDPRNCNANHYSVLNYLYQFKNFDVDRVVKLSTEELAIIDENAINEQNLIRQADGTPVDTAYTFIWSIPGTLKYLETLIGVNNDVDIDNDLGIDASTYALNINNFGLTGCSNDISPTLDALPGVNDWAVQDLLHRSSTNFQLGVQSLNPLDPLAEDSSFAVYEVSTTGGDGFDLPTADAGGPYFGNEGDDILLDSSGSSDSGGICGVTSTSGVATEVFDNCVAVETVELGVSTGQRLWDLGPNEANGEFDEPGVDARAGLQTPLFLKDDETSKPIGGGLFEDGEFNVGLAVWDASGNGATTITTVTIANVAPSVSASVNPTSINEGDTVTLAPSTFTDPGIDDNGLLLKGNTATKDWGDGSALENCTNLTCLTEIAGSAPVFNGLTKVTDRVDTTGTVAGGAHVYVDDDADDTYTISVQVTDKDGGVGIGLVPITVLNALPVVTAAANPAAINEGDTITLASIATFTDAGVSDTHTATIDWGDGSALENCTTGPCSLTQGAGSGSVAGSHTYDNDIASPFTVTITVTDKDGGVGSATLDVTVNNIAPQITAVNCTSCDAENEIVVGLSTDVVADFTDAAGDTHAATIDWGDGTDSTLGVVNELAGTVSGSHVYSDIGPYVITVTVNDGSDSATNNSLTVRQVIGFDGTTPITEPVNNARFAHDRNVPSKFIANDNAGDPILGLDIRIFTQCTDPQCTDTTEIAAVSTQAGVTDNVMGFNPTLGGYSYQMDISDLQFKKGAGITHDIIFRIFVNEVPFEEFRLPIKVT